MAINATYGLGFVLSGRETVSRVAGRVGRSFGNMSQRVSAAAKAMNDSLRLASGGIAVFAVGLRAMKGLFGLAQDAGKFNQEMAAVKAIMNVTAKQFRELQTAAFKAGMATQFSPLQAAQALRSLGQAGLSASQAMKVLRPSLDLAAVSLNKLSPERAAGVVNAALKTFGMRASEARKAVDNLVFATNRFNISIQDLPLAIGNVSRGAVSLNQSMGDTMIALGLVKNVLPEISRAATLTSSAMLRIADPTIQKKLRQLGVNFKDAKGNFLPFIDIVKNLDDRLRVKFPKAADRTAAAVKLLGKQGIAPFAIITKQLRTGIPVQEKYVKGMAGVERMTRRGGKVILTGAAAIKFLKLQFLAARGEYKKLQQMGAPAGLIKMARDMKREGGASTKFVQTLLNTFTGQITLMKGAFQSLKIAIGQPLAKAFKPFVSALYKFFSRTTFFINNLDPKLKAHFAKYAIGAAGVTMLVGVLMGLAAAAKFLGGALIAVLAPVLGKIALLVAAGYLLYKAWTTNFLGIRDIVKSVFSGFWATFKPIVANVLPALKEAFLGAFKAINELFVAFGMKSMKASDASGWKAFGRVIGVVSAAVIKGMAAMVKVTADLISGLSKFFALFKKSKGVVDFFKRAGGLVGRGVRSLGDFIMGKPVKPGTTAPAKPKTSALPVTPGAAKAATAARTVTAPAAQTTGATTATAPPTSTARVGTVNLSGNRVGSIIFDQKKTIQRRQFVPVNG